MKDEKKTNNLEYCVLESVRMLRMLLKKMKNEKKGGGGAEVVEHAESISYYVGNDSAEMATVLRIDATTLTRLREKMEVHLCTVFHSTCNPIILKRNATKVRMLQDHDKNQSLNFTQAT